jgi:hypothetical protein
MVCTQIKSAEVKTLDAPMSAPRKGEQRTYYQNQNPGAHYLSSARKLVTLNEVWRSHNEVKGLIQ